MLKKMINFLSMVNVETTKLDLDLLAEKLIPLKMIIDKLSEE